MSLVCPLRLTSTGVHEYSVVATGRPSMRISRKKSVEAYGGAYIPPMPETSR